MLESWLYGEQVTTSYQLHPGPNGEAAAGAARFRNSAMNVSWNFIRRVAGGWTPGLLIRRWEVEMLLPWEGTLDGHERHEEQIVTVRKYKNN